MRVLFIQHDHVSPPGQVGRRFSERGYDVVEHLVVTADRHHTPDVVGDFPDPTEFDAIVPMGAPWSAYDDLAIGSWVQPELALLRIAHEHDIPVLGICFGGQLLALAHGGAVTASPMPEIGWRTVDSADEAVVASGEWFEWHYDRWELPEGATEVARNDAASQAFVLGRNLAVQFHPELDSAMLAGWLANGGNVKLAEAGLDEAVIVDQTAAHAAYGAERARRLVDAFLDRVVAATP